MSAPLNILALETSTERLSVALSVAGQVLVEQLAEPAPHSERILNVVRALMDAADIGVAALHGVAFGAGPGAFTGVRLGCGVAQGIALARDIPVVAVNSLQALAQGCIDASVATAHSGCFDIFTANDARLQEVYYAGWRVEANGWRELVQTALARPEAVEVPPDGTWIGCGSGFAQYAQALQARLGPRLARIAPVTHPDARAILHLATAALRRGEGVAPEHALPIYVRNKVALTIEERDAERAAGAVAK